MATKTEQEKKIKHLNYLKKIGLLIPYDTMELYHGRVKASGETQPWHVDPGFDNSKNKINDNIMGIPCLCTASKTIAENYAKGRALFGKSGEMSVHRIVSLVENAFVVDQNFNKDKLSENERFKFNQTMSALFSGGLSQLSPVKYGDRNISKNVFEKVESFSNGGLISLKDAEEIYLSFGGQNSNVSKELVMHVVGSYNSREMLKNYPEKIISKFVLEQNEKRKFMVVNGEKYPINMEFVASWLFDNNILALKAEDKKSLDGQSVVYVFDLDKINTIEVAREQKNKLESIYSGLKFLEGFTKNQELFSAMAGPVKNGFKFLYRYPKYSELYEKTDGNFENFSIKEHTESVFKVFEDNFQNNILKEVKPFVKMVIFLHDIGKGLAVEKRVHQHVATKEVCNQFYEDFGVEKPFRDLANFIIFDSQKLTTGYYINKDKKALSDLYVACEEKLKTMLNQNVSKQQVSGLVSLCQILQTCDSASYTLYGVTHDKNSGVYYKNWNQGFTQSFKKPHAFTDRIVAMKDPSEEENGLIN